MKTTPTSPSSPLHTEVYSSLDNNIFKLLLLKVLKTFHRQNRRSFPWDNEKLNRVLFYNSSRAHVTRMPSDYDMWPRQEFFKFSTCPWDPVIVCWKHTLGINYVVASSRGRQKGRPGRSLYPHILFSSYDKSWNKARELSWKQILVGIIISNVDHKTLWSQSQSLRSEALALHSKL